MITPEIEAQRWSGAWFFTLPGLVFLSALKAPVEKGAILRTVIVPLTAVAFLKVLPYMSIDGDFAVVYGRDFSYNIPVFLEF